MDAPLLRSGCRRVNVLCRRLKRSNASLRRRCMATDAQEFRAAAPLRFDNDRNQFSRQRRPDDDGGQSEILKQIRVVPASPSYYTATPIYTDDFLGLSLLLRKYQHLPRTSGKFIPVAWRTHEQYVVQVNEPVKQGRFLRLMSVVRRLHSIHRAMMPTEVAAALNKFKRAIQPTVNQVKVVVPDKFGRTRGVGRRKSSSAECYVIEGDGEVLVNGRTLTNYFGRLRDRESAVWALKCTQRAHKYNVWVRATGGGTTGQAEAIQLAMARALQAQEPGLARMLKEAGALKSDTRQVERKKTNKPKARKAQTWVKR